MGLLSKKSRKPVTEMNFSQPKRYKFSKKESDRDPYSYMAGLEMKCPNLWVIQIPTEISNEPEKISRFLLQKTNILYESTKFKSNGKNKIEYLYFCKMCFSIYLSQTSYFYHNGLSKSDKDQDEALKCCNCKRRFENYCSLKQHNLPIYDNCNGKLNQEVT